MKSNEEALNWIESEVHTFFPLLKKWVAVNSSSRNIPGLLQMAHLLSDAFRPLKGSQELIPICDQMRALRIRKRPEAPFQIFLGGHLDTVHPQEGPFQKVEEIAPLIWQGPGIVDMKGGLLILLLALTAFEHSSLAHLVGWEVLITPDEEIGSLGSIQLFQEAAKQAHIGLIFEPAFPDGAFVGARKGSASYSLTAKGKAAHVGRDYQEGKSAVYAMVDCIARIHNLQSQQEGSILNIASLESKGEVNVVPDFCSCRLNLRSEDRAKMQEIEAHIRLITEHVSFATGVQIELIRENSRPPKPFDEKTKTLFEEYKECAELLKVPFTVRSSGGVCDGNLLAAAGLAVLDTAGAVGGNLHTTTEYIELSSIGKRAQLAALFLLRCAQHGKFRAFKSPTCC